MRRNLELNLGKVCNNRCILCLDARAPRESRRWVPLARAETELERGRADGADSLGLLGGEPTALLWKLAAVARAAAVAISVVIRHLPSPATILPLMAVAALVCSLTTFRLLGLSRESS